jgi:hypothetical protein
MGHTLLDFGDDDFTNGRPHPVIDPSLRLARLAEEAKIVGYVLGTDLDTPAPADQIAALQAAGVTVTRSRTETGQFARAIARKVKHA